MARRMALGVVAILLMGVGPCGGPEAELARKESAQTRYDIGLGALADGNMAKAIAEFREAVELDPQNSRNHHALGNAYYRNQQIPEAIGAFRRAVEIDPRFSDAWNDLGAAYIAQQNWGAAIDAFQRALANPRYLNPERAYINLGNIYFMQGQYEQAAEEFRKVIDIFPQSPDGYFLLGRTLLADGKAKEAQGHLERAVKTDGTIAIFHLEFGKAQLRLGRRAEARDSFRRVLELTPAGPEADEARRNLRSLQ
jgi:Tfp pilus assembly protein PilF